MRISPSDIAGVNLIAPLSPEFETALTSLLGRAPRELIAPAIPFSVIVANDTGHAICLLGVRFDMTGPRAKPCAVIHYADTLRNPEKTDFQSGVKRFVCAEPAYTALLLRRDSEPSTHGRTNLDNLRCMLEIHVLLDCVAYEDGRFEGPDSLGAFAKFARHREMESDFVTQVESMSTSAIEPFLKRAAEDPDDRARRTLARKLVEGLQTGGRDEMLKRARTHRLKIPLWR